VVVYFADLKKLINLNSNSSHGVNVNRSLYSLLAQFTLVWDNRCNDLQACGATAFHRLATRKKNVEIIHLHVDLMFYGTKNLTF